MFLYSKLDSVRCDCHEYFLESCLTDANVRDEHPQVIHQFLLLAHLHLSNEFVVFALRSTAGYIFFSFFLDHLIHD